MTNLNMQMEYFRVTKIVGIGTVETIPMETSGMQAFDFGTFTTVEEYVTPPNDLIKYKYRLKDTDASWGDWTADWKTAEELKAEEERAPKYAFGIQFKVQFINSGDAVDGSGNPVNVTLRELYIGYTPMELHVEINASRSEETDPVSSPNLGRQTPDVQKLPPPCSCIPRNPYRPCTTNPRIISLAYNDPSVWGITKFFTEEDPGTTCSDPVMMCVTTRPPVRINTGSSIMPSGTHVGELDFSANGAGFPLRVSARLASIDKSVGLFGKGWTYAHPGRIQRTTNAIVVTLPGILAHYQKTGGAYTSPPEFPNTLLEDIGGGEFRLTVKGDAQYIFDTTGQIRQLDYINGSQRTIYYEYDANGGVTITQAGLSPDDIRKLEIPGDPTKKVATRVTEYLGSTVVRNTYFEYDSKKRMTSITGPTGCITYHNYDDDTDNMTSMIDPEGYARYYEYDAENRTKSRFVVTKGTTYFEYSGVNKVVTNPTGDLTYYELDPTTYKVLSLKNSYGNEQEQVWNSTEKDVRQAVDELGNPTYYNYDSNKNTTRVTDSFNNTAYYDYNVSDNNMNHMKDARGQVTYYGYDANKNNNAITNPFGHTVYFEYDNFGQRTSQTNPLGNTTYFNYNSKKQLVSQVDALENAIYYEYDANGNQTAVKDAKGNTSYYEYDAMSRKTKDIDALGYFTQTAYNSKGRPIISLDKKNFATYYAYDVFQQMTSQTVYPSTGPQTVYFQYDNSERQTARIDELGNPTYMYYDLAGRQKGTIDALGNETYYEFDAHGNTLCSVDARDNATYFTYDSLNRQKEVKDALGNRIYYEFDAVGNRTITVDARNNATYFTYDALNKQKEVKDALGNRTYYEFDSVGNQTITVDARNNATYFYYDKLNRRKETKNALGNRTYYEFDGNGNQTAVVDARDNATYFTYDKLNRQKETKFALGNRTYYEFDENGNQTIAVDARDNATYFFYDELNRRKSTKNALGEETYFVFDKAGNTTASVDARLFATYYTFDALNRQKEVTDALGNRIYYEFDANGNQTIAVDARDNATYFTYDALNRQKETKDALGNRTYYEFDANGNQTITVDARSNATYFIYDVLNREIKRKFGNDDLVYFNYDANDNLLSEIRGVSTTGYTYWTYDALNRQSSMRHGFQTANYYAYDEVGNLDNSLDGLNVQVYYVYDELNRLSEIRYPNDGTVYFEYDANGNMTFMRDWTGDTYWEYDELNRKVCETNGFGSSYWTYDAAGNKTSVKDPKGNTTYFNYNALNLVENIISPDSKVNYYEYNENMQLKKIHYSGISGSVWASYFEYDNASRLTNIQHWKGMSWALEFVLERNGKGLVTEFDYNMSGPPSIHYFNYDNRDQLNYEGWLSGQTPLYAFYYEYDDDMNRKFRRENSDLTYYTVDSERVTRLDGNYGAGITYYAWDNQGQASFTQKLEDNLVTMFAFNDAHRVKMINQSGPTNFVYFDYDGLGRLYCLRDSDGTTYFAYDSDNFRPTVELDSSLNEKVRYSWGPSPFLGLSIVAVARKSSGPTYQFPLTDHLGSTHHVLNDSGNPLSYFEYEAFGTKKYEAQTTNFPYQHTHTRALKDYPLYFHPARLRDPKDGRWLSPDLIKEIAYRHISQLLNMDIFGQDVGVKDMHLGDDALSKIHVFSDFAEEQSIYQYCDNHPTNNCDWWGSSWAIHIGSENTIILTHNNWISTLAGMLHGKEEVLRKLRVVEQIINAGTLGCQPSFHWKVDFEEGKKNFRLVYVDLKSKTIFMKKQWHLPQDNRLAIPVTNYIYKELMKAT